MPDSEQDGDPFDSLLHLEERYHTEGYDLGVADGSRQGRIEGRLFGLSKGFEKHAEMGRLRGRGHVWKARLPHQTEPTSSKATGEANVASLGGSERSRKHLQRLLDLTNPETLSMENSEDAVAEFDERLKDARAKMVLLSKVVGEDVTTHSEGGQLPKTLAIKKGASGGRQTGEMEDFVGLPASKKT